MAKDSDPSISKSLIARTKRKRRWTGDLRRRPLRREEAAEAIVMLILLLIFEFNIPRRARRGTTKKTRKKMLSSRGMDHVHLTAPPFWRAVKTMLGSLRTCAARRPANLMATSFARRTKAGSAESVTSSVSLPQVCLLTPRQPRDRFVGQFRCSCGWFCTGILLPFATVISSDPT